MISLSNPISAKKISRWPCRPSILCYSAAAIPLALTSRWSVAETVPMESAATWWKLAAHARRIAHNMRDPYSLTLMREIASRYEALARRAGGSGQHPGRQDHHLPPTTPVHPPQATPHAEA